VRTLALAALVGVLHVHHAPSHDTDAPFEEVLEAAYASDLDFLVLAEHVPIDADGSLPAAEHAGLYTRPDGRNLLVLVGAEFGTRDGHLLAYDIPEVIPAEGLPGHEVIDAIHAAGGFAVVPHPFAYGGWQDWDAEFDGLEVHNNAAVLRGTVGPLLPLRLLRHAFTRNRSLRAMLVRPERPLDQWERLLMSGRRVVAFAGADAHRNVSLLGWQIDPYAEVFRTVKTMCPDGPLEPAAIWQALRSGACWIRYRIYDERAEEAREVRFPSGRLELQLDGGRRVLEIRQPPRRGSASSER